MTDNEHESLAVKVLREYDFTSGSELKESKLWEKAKAEASHSSDRAALEELAKVEDTVTLRGWFLRNRTFEDDDGVIEAQGPQFVLADTGHGLDTDLMFLDLGQELDAEPMTRVELGPVTVEKRLKDEDENSVTVTTSDENVDITTSQHDESFPSITLDNALASAHNTNNRGVIFGSANGYATLTIREENGVSFFTEEESFDGTATLKVIADDENNNTVSMKLDVGDVKDRFNITENEWRKFNDALAGKCIFAFGTVGVTVPADQEELFDTHDELQQEIDKGRSAGIIQQNGTFTHEEGPKKGTEVGVEALDLSGEEIASDVPTVTTSNGTKVTDIREFPPGEWQFQQHIRNTKATQDAWMHVRGDDGFIIFLDEHGIIAEDDEYQKAAEELEGLTL